MNIIFGWSTGCLTSERSELVRYRVELETLDHLFFYCRFSNVFWTHFEKYYFTLTKKSRVLSNQDIILGIITSPCHLLSYLILMGKLYIWDCRRKCIHRYIEGFKQKIKINYQTEKYIASKNNDLLNLMARKFLSLISFSPNSDFDIVS